MRGAFVVVMLGAAVASGQPAELPPERYGIRSEIVLYPQGTPRQTVATLAALVERKKFEYVVAQVLDPATVDARVAQRASAILPGIERQFDDLRAQQRLRPVGITPENRVPDDAKLFAEMVQAKANALAFTEVVKDVRAHLSEYPENLALFRKLAKDGDFADAATESIASLKADPTLKLFLKKDGLRWVVEDRKEDRKAEPKK